jgi:hypothetical protein
VRASAFPPSAIPLLARSMPRAATASDGFCGTLREGGATTIRVRGVRCRSRDAGNANPEGRMTEVPANQAFRDRSNRFHCGVFLRLLYVVDLANPRNSNNPGIIGFKRNRFLTRGRQDCESARNQR